MHVNLQQDQRTHNLPTAEKIAVIIPEDGVHHAMDNRDVVVINQLDPIEELYDMYLEKEDTPRIVELGDNGLDLVSDVEGLADPYMDL